MKIGRLEKKRPRTNGTIYYVLPSAVSIVRVVIAGLIIVLLGQSQNYLLTAAVFGVPLVFLLDAADGIVARRLNTQTLLGSFIDILADRVVELLFLQFFVRVGLVPLWFVLFFYGRIALTDLCRMCAFKLDQVSAKGIYLPRPWSVFVLSKTSRSLYAALKGTFFGFLLLDMYWGRHALSLAGSVLMITVLTFSFLRAVPILHSYLPLITKLFRRDRSNPQLARAHDIATRTTRVASGIQLAFDITVVVAILMKFAWQIVR